MQKEFSKSVIRVIGGQKVEVVHLSTGACPVCGSWNASEDIIPVSSLRNPERLLRISDTIEMYEYLRQTGESKYIETLHDCETCQHSQKQ